MLTLLPSAWVTLGDLGLPQLSLHVPAICPVCGPRLVNLARAFPTSSFGPHLPRFCQVCEKGVGKGVRVGDTL